MPSQEWSSLKGKHLQPFSTLPLYYCTKELGALLAKHEAAPSSWSRHLQERVIVRS